MHACTEAAAIHPPIHPPILSCLLSSPRLPPPNPPPPTPHHSTARLREQARHGTFKYRGMWQSLRLIAKEEGRRGLYAGMGTHVARVVPNTAIMFLSFELVNTFLGRRFEEKQRAAQDAARRLDDEVELELDQSQ